MMNQLFLPASLLFLAALWSAPAPLPAQESGKASVFDLLYGGDIRELDLTIDLDSVLANRRNDDRVGGMLRFTDAQGQARAIPVEVNVRGRFRRLRCDFPPLKLNFPKGRLRALGLDKHNDIKLVTHCLSDWPGEDILLREYLTYRMYRILTDSSFRSQLVRITYRHLSGKPAFTALGILLEDDAELAERLAARRCGDCYAVPAGRFDPEITARLSLFQYMIGNIDWSARLLRNVELIQPLDSSLYYLAPYDFDFSGLVNPPYVTIPKILGIKSVRQRVYLGFPYDAQRLHRAFLYIKSKKEDMLAEIRSCPHLRHSTRRDMLSYLESFFRVMDKMAPDYQPLIEDSRRF